MDSLIRVISLNVARPIVAQNLGLDVDSANASLQAACIRAALWLHSDGGRHPVHTSKLLLESFFFTGDAVRDDSFVDMQDETVDECFDPLTGPSTLRPSLEELRIMGDVAYGSGGWWLPAPTRLIKISRDSHLFVSGIPTNLLPLSIKDYLEHNGFARILEGKLSSAIEDLPRQTESQWSQRPEEPVDKWVSGMLTECSIVSTNDQNDALEFYCPQKNEPLQYARWTTKIKRLIDGRCLARTKRVPGRPMNFFWVEIQGGQVVGKCGLVLRNGDVRRVMYGFDKLSNASVRVKAYRHNSEWEFELANEIPGAERRLFGAIGKEVVLGNCYYPRKWRIPIKFAGTAAKALRELGISLVGTPELDNLR